MSRSITGSGINEVRTSLNAGLQCSQRQGVVLLAPYITGHFPCPNSDLAETQTGIPKLAKLHGLILSLKKVVIIFLCWHSARYGVGGMQRLQARRTNLKVSCSGSATIYGSVGRSQ